MLGLLLQLLLLTLALVRTSAKCAMTQTCVNPGNDPDFDECIPEAHREPVDPQPVRSSSTLRLVTGAAHMCWC